MFYVRKIIVQIRPMKAINNVTRLIASNCLLTKDVVWFHPRTVGVSGMLNIRQCCLPHLCGTVCQKPVRNFRMLKEIFTKLFYISKVPQTWIFENITTHLDRFHKFYWSKKFISICYKLDLISLRNIFENMNVLSLKVR